MNSFAALDRAGLRAEAQLAKMHSDEAATEGRDARRSAAQLRELEEQLLEEQRRRAETEAAVAQGQSRLASAEVAAAQEVCSKRAMCSSDF